MSVSVAVCGATGTIRSAVLIHLLTARLLKAVDRLVLLGHGPKASRARRMAMRVDLLDAFDDEEVDIEVANAVEEVRADTVIMAAGKIVSPQLKTRRGLADANAPILDDTACRLASAYRLIEATSPQAKIRAEPFIAVARLRSTRDATAHATLAFVATLIEADARKLHGQSILDGQFCGLAGALEPLRAASAAPRQAGDTRRVRLRSASDDCRPGTRAGRYADRENRGAMT